MLLSVKTTSELGLTTPSPSCIVALSFTGLWEIDPRIWRWKVYSNSRSLDVNQAYKCRMTCLCFCWQEVDPMDSSSSPIVPPLVAASMGFPAGACDLFSLHHDSPFSAAESTGSHPLKPVVFAVPNSDHRKTLHFHCLHLSWISGPVHAPSSLVATAQPSPSSEATHSTAHSIVISNSYIPVC